METKQKEIQRIREQADIDAAKYSILDQLSPEDVEKYNIVEGALGKMAEKGIMAYIFAELPNPNYPAGTSSLFQYNTCPGLVQLDKDGEYTEAFKDRMANFMPALWNAIFHHFHKHTSYTRDIGASELSLSDPEETKKLLSVWVQFTMGMIALHAENLRKGDEREQKLTDYDEE